MNNNSPNRKISTQDTPAYIEYPKYYDQAHTLKEDIPFYLEYAESCSSPILELACGTGRILVPLAQAGYRVTGLDFAPGMLAVCQQCLVDLGLTENATLIQADMTQFELPEKNYALAFIPLRSFSHLYTQEDQIACLKCIYEHLRPGGTLIIAMFALNHNIAAREEAGEFAVLKEFDLPNSHHVTQWQRYVEYDGTNQIIHFEFKFEERDGENKAVRQTVVPMVMRYTGGFELQLLFERVGFNVVDVFADYQKTPFSGKHELIMVGQKPT